MQLNRSGIWVLAATGALALGAIFATLAISSTWGTLDEDGFHGEAHLREAQFSFDGFGEAAFGWDDNRWDDADGIGKVRAAGTLHTIGFITAFVATATVGLAFFVRGVQLPILGAIMGSISFTCLLSAVILLPVGVNEVVAWFEAENGVTLGSVAWGGVAVPAIGTGLALIGAAASFVANRHDT